MQHELLSFPAPHRCSVEHAHGTYHTEKWTKESVIAYRRVGGRFSRYGGHQFADREAVLAAYADL